MVVAKLQDIIKLDPDTPVMSVEDTRKPPHSKAGQVWVLSEGGTAASITSEPEIAVGSFRSAKSGSRNYNEQLALTPEAPTGGISSKSDRSFIHRDDRSGDRGL